MGKQDISVKMIYLLCVTWLMRLISAETSCHGGRFEYRGEEEEECVFFCDEDNSIITSPQTELTFASIVEACGNVQTGLRFGYCPNGKSDLVWPPFGCQCPYCKCDTQNTLGTIQSFEKPIQKICFNCFCNIVVPSTLENGFECNPLYSAYKPYHLQAFSCPAAATCEDDSGNIYYPGQSWFSNVNAESEECNKFCYCNANGSTICETGFGNILSSATSEIKASFLDECDYQLMGCMDNPNRIFTNQMGPNCESMDCGWLQCTCPTGTIGEVWYSESETTEFMWGSSETLICSRCECMDGGGIVSNYAQCESIGSAYLPNSGYTCDASSLNTISCHEEWGGNVDHSKNITGTVNSRVCGTFGPEAWCSWDLYDEGTNNEYFDWGCNDFICGIYAVDGGCQFTRYNVTYECNGDVITDTETEYTYCCKDSDNCNFQDIDTSICSENTELSALLQQMHECANDIFDDGCESYEPEIINCNSVREYFEYQAGCICLAYAGLYQLADQTWKPWVENQIDTFFNSFSAWNEALQCDIVLTCDLTVEGGNVEDGNDTPQPTVPPTDAINIGGSPAPTDVITRSPITPWPTTTRRPTLSLNTESEDGMGVQGNTESTEEVTGTWVFVVIGIAGCCCILAVMIYINAQKHTHIITLILRIKPKECEVEEIENIEMNETNMNHHNVTNGAVYETPQEPEGDVEWMFGTSQRTNVTQ